MYKPDESIHVYTYIDTEWVQFRQNLFTINAVSCKFLLFWLKANIFLSVKEKKWECKKKNLYKDIKDVFMKFKLKIRTMQMHIYNPVKHLRWSFFAKIVNIFAKKAPSQMFDWVLNIPLLWNVRVLWCSLFNLHLFDILRGSVFGPVDYITIIFWN